MGCDIHLLIEYRKENYFYQNNEPYWNNFGQRYYCRRDYGMFGMLCKGVRTEFDNSFEPRGMPANIGDDTRSEFYWYITEEPNDKAKETTLKKAKQWEKEGCSTIIYHNEKPTWVTDPDSHSHSWLTANEFSKAVEQLKEARKEVSISDDYILIETVLKKLVELGYDARIVFWFDN